MIHITNGRTDDIIGFFTQKDTAFNEHTQNLETYQDSFEFSTFGDHKYAHTLTDMNRVIIPAEEGGYSEYVINTVRKSRDRTSKVRVKSFASYQMLSVAKVIDPTTISSYTPSQTLGFITNNTEWRPGIVESNATRTFHIENYTDRLSFLKTVANEFDLEIRFRVETDGKRVTGRFIDLLDRVGEWRGREITFGKDLDSIERTEEFGNIYTKLICLGPEDEEGNRLVVEVSDDDALRRWGRPHPITGELMHLEDTYEPTSEISAMTETELRQYGRTELNKRINSIVTYEAEVVDLENVPGMENKKIRFGDTIRIKDEKFNPPLYVEARIFEQRRDIFTNSNKKVKLGDFIEYTEEELRAVIDRLRKIIQTKISQAQLIEHTYSKIEIDGKDAQVKVDAEQDATQKAEQSISVSKDHADQVASTAESNANNYTNAVKSQIDAELLDKAGLEYVDGQLALKADSALVNTINNTVADLETTASNLQQAVNDNEVALNAQGGRITTVETDLNAVEGQLYVAITDLSNLEGTVSSQGTQISANSSAISLKANQSELDTVSGNVSDISGELNVLAGQVELKASQSALDSLEGDVTQISSDVSSLQVGVNGITADVNSLQTVTNGHTSDISSLNSQLTVQAGQISSKVDATYVTGAIADIEVGGRNLIRTNLAVKRIDFDGFEFGYYSIKTKVTSSDLGVFLAPVEPNTEYIITFKENGIGSSTRIIYYDEYPNDTILDSESTVLSPVSGRIITTKANTKYVGVGFYAAGTHPAEMYEIKLEKGNKATDWTPAPEDVQSEIDSVYNYANSEITQLAGRINLKADATTVTNLGTRLTTAETTIDAHTGQISSKVDATYVTGAIADIEVGGRNLLISSNLDRLAGNFTYNTTKHLKARINYYFNFIVELEPNTEYVVSNKKIIHDGSGAEAENTLRLTIFNEAVSTQKQPIGTLYSGSSISFKTNSNITQGDKLLFYPTSNTQIDFEVLEIKLEKGNKATDWTPAPEDVEAEISSLSGELSVQAGLISAKADSSTVNALGTRVSTAETAIDGLEGEIMSKVSTTEFNALDGTVSTLSTTVSQQATAISTKVDDGDVRSIFTQEAGSFTFDASQVNFTGHIFGQGATFAGDVVVGGIAISDNIIKTSKAGQIGESWMEISDGNISVYADGSISGSPSDLAGGITYSPNWYDQDSIGRVGVDWDFFTSNGSINLSTYSGDINLVTNIGEVNVISDVNIYRNLTLPYANGHENALYFPNNNFISVTQTQDMFAFYGNRANGANPFAVRSHLGDVTNASQFRTDLYVDSSGDTRVMGRLINQHSYDTTTGQNANLYVASNGYFARSSSAKKYKVNMQPANVDYKKLLEIEPYKWNDKGEVKRNGGSVDGLRKYYGAIADHFVDVGLPEYGVYNDETGELENFNDRAWLLLIPNINDIKQDLEKLETENQLLKNEIKIIKEMIS